MQEQELVERIRRLVPMLEAHALQAEQERKPVDAVMQAIEATGCYRYFVPKRYGGYEFSLEAFMDIGMLLGEGCLSTAWVTTFCMEHNWLLGLYNRQAQDEIFGKQPYIIAPGRTGAQGRRHASGRRLPHQRPLGMGNRRHARGLGAGGRTDAHGRSRQAGSVHVRHPTRQGDRNRYLARCRHGGHGQQRHRGKGCLGAGPLEAEHRRDA